MRYVTKLSHDCVTMYVAMCVYYVCISNHNYINIIMLSFATDATKFWQQLQASIFLSCRSLTGSLYVITTQWASYKSYNLEYISMQETFHNAMVTSLAMYV